MPHFGSAFVGTPSSEILALLERLRKIQALYDAPGTEGERAAAAAAAERVHEQLRAAGARRGEAGAAPPRDEQEFQMRIEDAWSRRLFIGVARHHGVNPYRYRGQRRTTLVVRTSQKHFDTVVWPHFQEAAAVLREHFNAIAEQVIAQALRVSGDDEVDERVSSAATLESST